MKIGSPEWESLISEGARTHGLRISDGQMAGFTAHATALLTWNQRVNLTRIVDPEAVAIRHFVDSLALVPSLAGCANILDIGSGGGFPGMVAAVMMPESRVVLVDAVRKKVSFLQYAATMNGISNVTAIHGRAEDLCRSPGFAKAFDAVVSRAMGDLSVTLRAAAPFAAGHARIAAMRGPDGDEECRAFMEGPDRGILEAVLGASIDARVTTFSLPGDHGLRHLLIFSAGRAAPVS